MSTVSPETSRPAGPEFGEIFLGRIIAGECRPGMESQDTTGQNASYFGQTLVRRQERRIIDRSHTRSMADRESIRFGRLFPGSETNRFVNSRGGVNQRFGDFWAGISGPVATLKVAFGP